MDKILTLIIPAFNMEKYLDRCLSSLIVDEEHMMMFEALIINDGSTDSTSEIGHQYEERCPESFRVIDKENGHYGSCVNRGLSEARGVFIKILDADDSLDSQEFSLFLDFINNTNVESNADLILSNYSFVRENNSFVKSYFFSHYDCPCSLKSISEKDRMDWFIHGLTYKTQLLKEIHYHQTEGISYTDNEWIFNPLIKVRSIYQFKGTLYRYTIDREGQSMSTEQRIKNLSMSFQVIESNVSFYHDNVVDDAGVSSFMVDRLIKEASHLYQLCLFTYNCTVDSLEKLKQFDRFLSEKNSIVYDSTGRYSITIGGIRFYPVSDWRGHNYKIKVAQILYRLADWFHKVYNRTSTK